MIRFFFRGNVLVLKYFFFTKNPNFVSSTFNNDIALLYLTSPVTLNNYIQLACLPSSSTTYPGTNVFGYAAGYGSTYLNGLTQNQLYNVKLTIYPPSNCPYTGFTTANQICAGNINGGQGTCSGWLQIFSFFSFFVHCIFKCIK